MLSNPADREKLFDAIKEMSNSMTRVDAEKDYQKDVIDKITDELDLEKKYIRSLARIYHKQNFTTVQQEQEDLVTLYEEMTKAKG